MMLMIAYDPLREAYIVMKRHWPSRQSRAPRWEAWEAKMDQYDPTCTPLKTNMTLENPCSKGNTSSNGGFSIVMLVFRGVSSREPFD